MPLVQPKTIRKKLTTNRGGGADLYESNSYATSREVLEGNSTSVREKQMATQSKPQGRYKLRDEPFLSHSTSEGLKSAS